MIKVLEVYSNGTALISTAGLRRVVIQPGNEIADELVQPFEAKAFLKGFNGLDSRFRAEAITYGEAARREAAASVASREPQVA